MAQIILIIIGVVIIVLFLMRKTREQVVGICATAIGLDTKKRERKEKIWGEIFVDMLQKST